MMKVGSETEGIENSLTYDFQAKLAVINKSKRAAMCNLCIIR